MARHWGMAMIAASQVLQIFGASRPGSISGTDPARRQLHVAHACMTLPILPHPSACMTLPILPHHNTLITWVLWALQSAGAGGLQTRRTFKDWINGIPSRNSRSTAPTTNTTATTDSLGAPISDRRGSNNKMMPLHSQSFEPELADNPNMMRFDGGIPCL